MNLDQTNLEILKLLSEGLTAKEIAPKVFLSYETVVKRIENMKEQTGCKNRTELVFCFYHQIQELNQAS
jgi:DNA-binding NarL/FixJ family response regulator